MDWDEVLIRVDIIEFFVYFSCCCFNFHLKVRFRRVLDHIQLEALRTKKHLLKQQLRALQAVGIDTCITCACLFSVCIQDNKRNEERRPEEQFYLISKLQ